MSTLSISKFAAKVFAVILAAAPLTAASHAQSNNMVRVNVPFGFETTARHLPAGVYTIEVDSQHVMVIRGRAGSAATLYSSEENRTTNGPGRLIFRKRGGQYFLGDLYLPGSSLHAHYAVSKREKQLEIATNGAKSGAVELAELEIPR